MGFSRAYDRFLDLLKRTLPRASDTADKRARARPDQTKGTNTDICRGRDNLWNFPIPFYPQGRNSKTRLQRGRSYESRTYVKANGQRRTESRRGRIEFPSEGENVVVRKSCKQRLLFFPVFIHDCTFPVTIVSKYSVSR